MGYVVESANNEEFTLEIVQDDDYINPREDDCNFGTMICWHSRYNLGDGHNYSEPRDFLESLAITHYKGDENDIYEMKMSELMEIIKEDNVILPLYLYDHSGIT